MKARRLFLAIAAAASLALAVPATALASTPPSASTSATQSVVYHIATPYGEITYGWRPAATEANAVVPDSASGCSQDVCISLIGSGAKVNDWSSTAYWDGATICTHSLFLLNDRVIRQGSVVCGDAGVFFTDWPANKNFPTPSLACNEWAKIPGEACETIHK